jgi:hypothetical protein
LAGEVIGVTDIGLLIETVEAGDLEKVRVILDADPELINQRDETGGTVLHAAAFSGNRPMVHLLVERGAEINSRDAQFGATPAGWAIEYLRELGGFLGIELDDFAFAIRRGDVEWVRRFVQRFPDLRSARDTEGIPFKKLAEQFGNQKVMQLFD